MVVVQDRKFVFLLLLCLLAPTLSHARVCFKAKDDALIRGMNGPARVAVAWSENGDAMDQILIANPQTQVRADMVCTDAAPIRCNLGQDGGQVSLVFDQNHLKVIAKGFYVGGRTDKRLSVRPGNQSVVYDLMLLSDEECDVLFPNHADIEIFPQSDPQQSPGVSR